MLISKQIIRRNILEKFSNNQTQKYLTFDIPKRFKETNYLFSHTPSQQENLILDTNGITFSFKSVLYDIEREM